MEEIKKQDSLYYVDKSFKDCFLSVYLAVSTLFGTKRKVDKMNEESVENVRNEGGNLTVLLHGYMANYHRSMYSTINWFKKNGLNIVSIGYNYRFPSEEEVIGIKNKVDEVMCRAETERINLVGISLGGVMARYYAERLGGWEVIDKMVTVYTPLKPVLENDIGYRIHVFLRNNPHLANDLISETKDSFSVKNHLAVYGLNDRLISKECTKTKRVRQIGVKGGHTFVSYNLPAMRVALEYLVRKN